MCPKSVTISSLCTLPPQIPQTFSTIWFIFARNPPFFERFDISGDTDTFQIEIDVTVREIKFQQNYFAVMFF